MVLDLSYLNKDTPPEKRPKVLLLACFTCKSVEEIPYDDRFPNTDRPGHDQNRNPFLHAVVDQHGPDHKGTLADADLVIWQHPDGKRQITEQFQKGSPGLDVFGTNFYATKDNYSADAMRCYAEHNRPQGQCSDYKSEKKVLKPETSKERREAGLDPSKMPKMHLCDFCPVKSYNMKKFNESKGLYK